MKIATFNVNSIRRRVGALCQWLDDAAPDVVLLQELKAQAEQVPILEIEAKGYRVELVGQKAYNGVAIVSRHPITVIHRALPGDTADEHARYIEADIAMPGGPVRVASIYLPNGNPAPGDKYDYKLRFLNRLYAHARELLELEIPVVLGGDYNVVPADIDVHDPVGTADDALCRPETRQAYRRIVNLGYTEAYRTLHPNRIEYSFWDYQAGAWQKNDGWRIDHLLLSPQAADRLLACEIDRDPRGRPEASDHTPVWCQLR
ncbi:MAG: xthA [Alphaproteobacteria bacterium]|nr:xthA [Alphaproteobacteria bacterium]